ncbi:MAG: hypothetical protein ACT4QG_04270 [Sporichthyaceae bacterium]
MPKPPVRGRAPRKKKNPLDAAKITYIDYKDVALLPYNSDKSRRS